MSYRRLFIFALLTSPTMLWAQFTTFIPPQNKAADSAKSAVVVQQRVQADSIMKVKLTDMKVWVDSAAGVAPAVVRWLPELQVLVTAFVPGRPMEAAELRDPATLAVVTDALRRYGVAEARRGVGEL